MDELRRLIERARRSAEEARHVAAETRRLVRTSRQIQDWTGRVQGRVAGEAAKLALFSQRCNRLLALLPAADFQRLAPHLQGVAFSSKQVLHRANSAIDYVYFPVSGLLSATICMRDGDAIEIAAMGKEGMAGLMAGVGNSISPHDVVVQIPGSGLRLDVAAFQAELKRGGALGDILTRYRGACAVSNAYQIACNGLHNVGKRCCRRLLDTQDRIASDVLPLTHDSLALTLGVRRATVTEELGSLQARGVIQNQRGQIKIVDRPKLQALSCECYQAVNEEMARLLGTTTVANGWPSFDGAASRTSDSP
jgi:CRP-like cAMP-binding protein